MKTTVKTSTKDVVVSSLTDSGAVTLTLTDSNQSSTVVLTSDQIGALICGLEMADALNWVRALHA